MQQNLIDAARAVVAADRAGELTDEHIQALEAAADAEAVPAGEPVAHVKRGTNTSFIDSTDCKTCWEDLPDGTALYTKPQAVPAECSWKDAPWMSADTEPSVAYMYGWNSCRGAMLVGEVAQHD